MEENYNHLKLVVKMLCINRMIGKLVKVIICVIETQSGIKTHKP